MMTLMKEEKIAYTKELSSIVFKDNKISGNKFSSRFQPSLNHLYSGRNNDDKGNFKEYIYFFTTIIPTFLFTRKIGNSDYCFE